MFNGAKQTFGAPATNNAFGFANTTASPFGAQSAFGKPATQGFGAAPAFGQGAPSAFGQPAQQQQQPNQSLFAAPGGQQSAFGAPAAQQGGFGGFGQPQQQQQQQQQLQQPSLFGAAPQTAQQNTSLFGQASTSAFGAAAKAPAFGFGGAQPTASLFSQQPSTSAAAGTGGAFGGFGATGGIQQQQAGGMFGGGVAAGQQQQQSAFGQQVGMGGVATGTAIAKYQESLGTDTLMKNGQSNNVSTKQHCITAMKEYEGKSFEELRMEDYMANRKGPQPGGGGGGLLGVGGGGGMFGATAGAGGNQSLFGGGAATTMGGVASTSIFGQPAQPQGAQTMGAFGAPAANTSLGGAFGQQQQSAFGQPQAGGAQAGGLFGNSLQTTMGQGTASAFGGFSGGAATAGGGLFGAAKPFGQAATPAAGGMFGQASVSAAPTFGQPAQPLQQQTGAFGSFGQAQQQQQQPLAAAPLFGQAQPAAGGGLFGQTSQAPAAGGFGSFAQPATSQAGGGMFGQKPASSFGAIGTGAFGAPATSTATGFGSFGQAAAQPQNPSIFGAYKPPTSFGSFGTAAPLIQQTPNTGMSMFGNNAAKPGGLFGQTAQPQTTGLFGSSFAAPNSTLGGGGLGMGQNTMGGLGFGGIGNAQAPAAGIPIHQQILSMATSPYGDNPIFKDLQPSAGLSVDALKPTNPAAQKALLESAAASQFKVSPHIGGRSGTLKLKPVGSLFSKKSLFGGLEEFDSSVEESFSLKPNAKRLIIKPKAAATTPAAAAATASPARSAAADASGGGSAHKRLNIPAGRAGTPRADDADGSFRNQIPLQAPPSNSGGVDSGRRESWLHSNALEKVTKQNRQPSDGGVALDNTIQELVSGGGGADERSARLPVLLERRDANDEQPRSSSANPGKSSGGGGGALGAHTSSDSLYESRSFLDDTANSAAGDLPAGEPHPCGVTLLRAGYYTIPALDALVDYLAADGSCRVDSLTIGRRGYGSVYFDTEIDVAGMNLDELVHFRHKEVIIYPDDENKPPVGCDLNRRAEVTLDQVWPHDKTLRQPIKDRERLETMDYQLKLRRVCEKHDMRFVDYRPETGSWVFRVDHFSKYGLNDSDDEDDEDVPVDPKKAKLNAAAVGQQPSNAALLTKTMSGFDREMSNNVASTKTAMGLGGGGAHDNIERHFTGGETFVQHSGGSFQPLSPSSALAMDAGTDSHKLQLMKASFFVDDDFDGKSVASEQLDGRDSPDQTVPHPAYLRHHHHRSGTGSVNILRHPTAPPSSFGGASVGSSMPAPSSIAASSSTTILTDNISHRTLLAHAAAKASHAPLLLTANFSTAPTAITAISRPLGPRSAPLHVRPKVALVRIPRTVIPLGKSILAQLLGGRSAVDMAFQLGRTYRIGWTAPNAMITLNTLAGSERLVAHQRIAMDSPALVAALYAGRRPSDRTRAVLVLSRIESAAPIAAFAASIEPHLQLQLRHTRSETPAGEACPRRRAAPSATGGTSTLFAEHLEVAGANARLGDGAEYVATVWSLCDALWGYQEELDGLPHGGHATVMRRRELLSEWLEAVVADEQQARHAKSTYLEHLLDLLHTHRVTEACDLCFNNSDLNLAFMLGQLSGGPAVRQLIQHQLFAWQEVQADGFIAPERLRAYMLAAGVSLVSSAHGAINLFADLDWLRAFALNVWYLSAATASITDALLAYEHSYQSDEFQAQPPMPPYTGAYRAEPSSGVAVEDLRYHLLKLYARRSHPLESLLNPATHTADAMDFRLSWLLMQTLDSVGYRHCAASSVAQLHTSFAAQLEQAGMWHWAVFVLMHLAEGRQRELAVQAMLYRYVRLGARDVVGVAEQAVDEQDDGEMGYAEKERFVVDELRVPVQWLLWAKAVRAGALGRWHAQAELLLQAEQWSMAHEVIMLHIAPEAIINDNIAYVHRLLQRFPDNGRPVPNWSNQGGILLEYIRLGERFERLKAVPDAHIDAAWLQLQQPLSELCSRINLFPCPTAKHRLCQSEIAQRLANLVSGMRLTGGPAGPADLSTCTLMRVILEKLPLPQEYAAQKLRTLLEDGRLIEEMQQQSEVR